MMNTQNRITDEWRPSNPHSIVW